MKLHTVAPSIDTRDRSEIERIFAPLLARHPDAKLKLFGSRARGDARRTSDIDIALASESPFTAMELAMLREALEESLIPFRVDLVDYAIAASELRAAIDREGVAWHA